MPPITDLGQVRDLLRTDRVWGVYALGELMPGAAGKAQWFAPDLALVYRDFGTCIFFAMGEASVPEALTHVSFPLHLQLRPQTMEMLERLTVVVRRVRMWRMGWCGDRSGWVDTSRARRLTSADVVQLERLYQDGAESGEAPDFFFPEMVSEGVFFGVFDGEVMLAAAGTHLCAPDEGAAAIGNVYTRRTHRGRGLGKIVTCATLRELDRLETVALNVRVDNAAAIGIYEALGFRKHCEFFEGLAERAR